MQSQVERGGVCVGGDGSCGAEYGEVETRTRTGRQRRRRDAWTVHSKPRARGQEGVNPESKGPVERGVPYGVDAGGGRRTTPGVWTGSVAAWYY